MPPTEVELVVPADSPEEVLVIVANAAPSGSVNVAVAEVELPTVTEAELQFPARAIGALTTRTDMTATTIRNAITTE